MRKSTSTLLSVKQGMPGTAALVAGYIIAI